MRSPFELLADLYDYHFNYYRYYLHRRLLFSEISEETIKRDFKYNIFENNDSENVGDLVKQTTLIGFSLGLGLAPIKYVSMTDIQKTTARRAGPAALGVIALCTGIGIAYGTVVNLTSNFRGQKNDHVNHAVAALMTFPTMGVYAKTNKVQWGVMNAIVAAGVLSYLKYAYSGNFIGVSPSKQSNRISTGTMPSHYKA